MRECLLSMEVKLLFSPKHDEALDLIYAACRQCYSKGFIGDVDLSLIAGSKKVELIKKVYDSGHHSTLEHVNFTFAIEGFSRNCTHQLVRHRMASFCVAEDTKIKTSSKRTNNKTIAELFNLKEQYKGLIKVRCVDELTKLISYNNLIDISYSGKKECYEITTEFGYKIKTTALHQFYTPTGWKKLQDLSIGDLLYVNGEPCYQNKDWLNQQYRIENKSQKEIGEFCGVSKHTIRSWIRKFHLQKDTGSWSIGKEPHNKGKTKENYKPLQIVSEKLKGNSNFGNQVGESNSNWKGNNVTDNGARLRLHRLYKKTNVCSNCGFKGYTELHHLDKNPKNNKLDNIKELCVSCHHAIHHKEIRNIIIPNKIVSITPVGIIDTYDISMPDPNHNYIANGFVVHNSQQSQRYCDSSESQIVIPEAFDEEAKNDLLELERLSLNYYKKHKERGFKNEDLRSFLLSCTKSNLVVTLNIRELIHILELRLCKQAQKEIRLLVTRIHQLCKEVLPEIFEHVGPKCQQLGYCNEGERSCGLMPLKEDIFWYIEELQYRKRLEKNAPILNEKFKAIFEDMAKEGGDMIE